MHRLLVIVRHTFFDAVVQPIYSLLLLMGALVLVIFGMLPFFTLGEDTRMYISVALDVIILAVLLATLFSTSKAIHEEIEDRTMMTLMSKPLRRWEVVLGKYFGIVGAAMLGVAALGAVLVLCCWLRIPTDYQLRAGAIDQMEARQIHDYRAMHIAGVLPSLVLAWQQVAVLAAVGIALSTRFSLVVNLPTVILLYIAGNLTRFLFPLSTGVLAGRPTAQAAAWTLSLLLPYLEVFDLRKLAVMGVLRVAGTAFADNENGVKLSAIWEYVGAATVYAFAYAGFALSAGLWLFHSRELGGGDS
jgi:ABC-type transport system involved in multi-copper enzyme maturation permease subunit